MAIGVKQQNFYTQLGKGLAHLDDLIAMSLLRREPGISDIYQFHFFRKGGQSTGYLLEESDNPVGQLL